MVRKVLLALVVATASEFACSAPAPAPQTEYVYVAKVKNVLTGLPPTDQEIQSVGADPAGASLGALVDGWMQRPEYARKMMRFFQLAFQQTQITRYDFVHQVQSPLGFNPGATPLLLQNVEESFARTMLALAAQGRPLTAAMTTRQFMMTTALKELYAFLDVWQVDDDGHIVDAFRATHREVPIIVGAAQGPIPLAETLDPTSPNYMHWYDPDVGDPQVQRPGCQDDPVSLAPYARNLHYLLLGSIDGRDLANGGFCQLNYGTPRAMQFAPGDFSDWTMVTVRPPDAGEATTTFYDLPGLRAARELVLSVPRVGFFSTPAFLANWPTNNSNQMRATMNQTLIVATGASIDGLDPTIPPDVPGLDAVHARGACVGCHQLLDPTRSILSSTWSWNYHNQVDEAWKAQPGLFAFRGVIRPVRTLADLGDTLAAHPLVAPGWVQKLCAYVNSAPCDEADPEFQRLVTLFRQSDHSWNALVKAMVTSPLTTNVAAPAMHDEVVAVARRDHLCAALDARLGFTDLCGLDALGVPPFDPSIPQIVSGLPSDAYGRGAVSPILPTQPTLFFATGVENICESLATQLVDPPAGSPPGIKQWSSAHPDAAIHELVTAVMALAPSDPRAAPLEQALRSHYTSALDQPGATATLALRSTFMVACQAPSATSVGM